MFSRWLKSEESVNRISTIYELVNPFKQKYNDTEKINENNIEFIIFDPGRRSKSYRKLIIKDSKYYLSYTNSDSGLLGNVISDESQNNYSQLSFMVKSIEDKRSTKNFMEHPESESVIGPQSRNVIEYRAKLLELNIV